MKKFACLLIALSVGMFSFVGCGGDTKAKKDDKKPAATEKDKKPADDKKPAEGEKKPAEEKPAPPADK
jgi:hypothetical protein